MDFLGQADAEGEEGAQRDEKDDYFHEDVEGGAGEHVDALVDAGADRVWDENFPVMFEGSDCVRKGGDWKGDREGRLYRHWRKRKRKATIQYMTTIARVILVTILSNLETRIRR